jgi:hypothetical protein
VPNEQQSQRPQIQCRIRAGRPSLHVSIILPPPRLHPNPIRSSLRLCNQLDGERTLNEHDQEWKHGMNTPPPASDVRRRAGGQPHADVFVLL